MLDIELTRSDLEWKRNCKILVPTAPFGGSSKAVNAKVDSKTFKYVGRTIKIRNKDNIDQNVILLMLNKKLVFSLRSC